MITNLLAWVWQNVRGQVPVGAAVAVFEPQSFERAEVAVVADAAADHLSIADADVQAFDQPEITITNRRSLARPLAGQLASTARLNVPVGRKPVSMAPAKRSTATKAKPIHTPKTVAARPKRHVWLAARFEAEAQRQKLPSNVVQLNPPKRATTSSNTPAGGRGLKRAA